VARDLGQMARARAEDLDGRIMERKEAELYRDMIKETD